MTAPLRPTDAQALEARVAARIAAGLAEQASEVPHDIAERLRVARDQAVARAALLRRHAPQPRSSSEPIVLGVTSHGLALLGQPAPWWQRLASVFPLAILVLGLLLIQQQAELEQVHAAAEVDALLLADDLPPDAYLDPGFAQFLQEPMP
ncbi:MAG: DUF3619 family protein [Rubrivivax sp.]|nr:DUF3619 family protein [Rubrivivax sp.]